ncbi:hypothetical protein, partial [Ralstonia solanacearum]|uniref:hypothetical protein n=1 Tax=Ralstonia solanacearum TaxID=305 RepID=UPI001E42302D
DALIGFCDIKVQTKWFSYANLHNQTPYLMNSSKFLFPTNSIQCSLLAARHQPNTLPLPKSVRQLIIIE